MRATEELISNIFETRFKDFTQDIVERAKDEVIDVIGCAIGGANDTGCPMILDLIRESWRSMALILQAGNTWLPWASMYSTRVCLRKDWPIPLERTSVRTSFLL